MLVYGEKTKHKKEMKQAPGKKKITTKPDPEISHGKGESLNKDTELQQRAAQFGKGVKPQRRSCTAGYGWGNLNFAAL